MKMVFFHTKGRERWWWRARERLAFKSLAQRAIVHELLNYRSPTDNPIARTNLGQGFFATTVQHSVVGSDDQ